VNIPGGLFNPSHLYCNVEKLGGDETRDKRRESEKAKFPYEYDRLQAQLQPSRRIMRPFIP
jgi:hypothetical protein